MLTLTIVWIALGFLVGFGIYLWPRGDRPLSLAMATSSLGYGLYQILSPTPLNAQLLDRFGVSLLVDDLSSYLIVTNALVTAAVILYCWPLKKASFFYVQTIILHSSMNAVFIGADFISLYVALEVISIAAFLLITYPRTNRAIWIGLRYLFVSNTAMLFYLIGAVQVYQTNGSFAYAGLQTATTTTTALILLGLLTKGGIFISGLWLPMTHSEADTPVSALLSGAVVTTGIFPIIRCALMADTITPLLQIFSVATALIGVTYAVVETDSKRLLAASTISQAGFVLAAPAAGGFYALTHGLAKASMFLIAGGLPSRKFSELRKSGLPWPLWGGMAIAALSVCGLPLLPGFEAKALTLKSLAGWHSIAMNIAPVGTAIAFAKFIFLPIQSRPDPAPELSAISTQKAKGGNRRLAVGLLLTGLLLSSGWHYQQYTPETTIKALLTIAVGWLFYGLVSVHLKIKQPQQLERVEHLIGAMSLMLIVCMGVLAF